MLTVNVVGTPVPQGSKVANRFGHGVRDSNATKLKPWRAEVAGCVMEAIANTGWTTLDEPAEVSITFWHARPASHFGTGRNAGVLKPAAPAWKATKPDVDKLARAILDALTDAAAVRDDSRVARLVTEDRYADPGAATGARITVRPLTSDASAGSPAVEASDTPQGVLFG